MTYFISSAETPLCTIGGLNPPLICSPKCIFSPQVFLDTVLIPFLLHTMVVGFLAKDDIAIFQLDFDLPFHYKNFCNLDIKPGYCLYCDKTISKVQQCKGVVQIGQAHIFLSIGTEFSRREPRYVLTSLAKKTRQKIFIYPKNTILKEKHKNDINHFDAFLSDYKIKTLHGEFYIIFS